MSGRSANVVKAVEVVRRLVGSGYPSYFVGGAVRDMLMGNPAADIDIATAAPPDVVLSLFDRAVPIGRRFGVVVVVEEGEAFEVATFRSEGPYVNGRRPAWVSGADAGADVVRRDFTLNGLLYDPIRGEIVDRVGGTRDIEQRLVRSIGDPRRRFGEDKLRLLRAVRFASSLGFQIEERTGEVVREMAGDIRVVAAERIREELVKMLTGPHADRGLVLLDDYGLLDPILPEVARMKGVEQGQRHHPEGDVFTHTVRILSFLSQPTVNLAFAALLHDVGKPPTCQPHGRVLFPNHAQVGAEIARSILDRLRFDRRTRDRVVEAVANHLRFLDVGGMRPATLRRFLSRENFAEELELHRLDSLAGTGDLSRWHFVREKLKELEGSPLPRPPLLRGQDLLDLGFHAGPRVGAILEAVEEKRLEGSLKDREDARRWVLGHYTPDEAGS